MQKSKIYLLFAVSTIVLAGLVSFLLPIVEIRAAVIVGLGMLLMLAAPIFIVTIMSNKIGTITADAERELGASQMALSDLREKFAEVTTMDELTGCSNKRHFLETLIQHRAMSERGTYAFTVAVSQVDQFNEIIEKQGLGRGNEVLQLFSRIVKAALREVDIIARLDTDKFGLILSGCSEEDALRIINRISQLITNIQVNDEDDLKITSSGGITSFHGTESPEELIEHAEQALQFAIEQGRDRVAGYNYTAPDTAAV